MDSPSESPGGANPASTLTSDSWLPEWRQKTFPLLAATPLVIIRYSSPRERDLLIVGTSTYPRSSCTDEETEAQRSQQPSQFAQ